MYVKTSVFIRQNVSICNFSGSESWVILSPIEQRIKAKIEAVGTPLKDWDINIYRGILTGYNEAFIIDGKRKDELIAEDPKSAEIIRPLLRGRDIKRYSYEFADKYLITTFPSLKIDIEQYPAIKQHLLGFGYDRLKQTGEKGARKKTSNKWFETQDSISYWEDFYRQKIIYPGLMRIAKSNIENFPRFYIDNEDNFFFGNDCYFLVGNQLDYLFLVLNSSLIGYLFHFYIYSFDETGYKVFTDFFKKIPILLPNEKIKIESKILNTKELDVKKINDWVYKIYKLNENEKLEIENHLNSIIETQ